jgi:hypothetical protein
LLVCGFLFALVESAQVTREATLAVRILDNGRPTPARIRLQDSRGTKPSPPKQALAVMYGQQDRAEGYASQPDGSFYVDGAFDLRLPPGDYDLTVSKGFEYVRQAVRIHLDPAASVPRDIALARWIDMPARGWYSSDDHIHLRRSPANDPNITRWIAAEDIHVGHILQMGDFWATFFSQYGFGDKGRYVEGDTVLSPGQEEPRTPEIGHTISLGAQEFVRMSRDYYSYDRYFDRVHSLGGVTGFAHQAMSFFGYRGMAVNTLRGKTDFLEVEQFCVQGGPLLLEHYYRFLDLGFKLTALAGSDFPWCGQGFAQIGNARFYAYTGGPFSFDNWFSSLKAGHTFVSTGPMVLLTVNGRIPGDSLDVAPGTKLQIHAEAFGDRTQAPLRSLEIIGHGKTLARTAGDKLDFELTPQHGIWIAARCDAGPAQNAHTTPVYVTVNADGFHNPENAAANVAFLENSLKEIEGVLAHPGTALDEQATRHRAQLERQIAEARTTLGKLNLK